MLYTQFGTTTVKTLWQCAYCEALQQPTDAVYFQFTDPIDWDDRPLAEDEFTMMCRKCRFIIEDTILKFNIPIKPPMDFLWGVQGVIKDGTGPMRHPERPSTVGSGDHKATDSLS